MLESNATVFVYFYADWCGGHCFNPVPTIEKVASIFANDTNCIFTKLEITGHENYAKQSNVGGVPSMFLFKGRKDIPIRTFIKGIS